MWKTDGSTASTVLVKDIFPGENSSRPAYLPYPDDSQDPAIATTNGKLFFEADDGVHGAEPWMSDGTEMGTMLVKDIYPGMDEWGQPNSSNARYFSTYKDRFYFTAQDDTHGQELWQSDGSSNGTIMLKDIYPGAAQGCYECSRWMAELDGLLYFPAYNNLHGNGLWRTDGTPSGTLFALVSSVGEDSYGFRSLVTQNGALYFFAGNDSVGEELFTSDGTQAGTRMVKDINPGEDSSSSWKVTIIYPDSLNRLYFLANDGTHGPELWISDGSEAGTVLVKDINTLTEDSVGLGFPAVGIDNVLYFLARDRVHGLELWRSDGTEVNTLLVKDIVPDTSVINSYGFEWLAVGDVLFFTVDDGTHGFELWRTDGTEPGTYLVNDINAAGPSEPASLVEMDGWLYFSADDGQHGAELWKSDGSTTGTALVKDIHPAGSSSPVNLTVVDGVLYFAADDGEHGFELWRSDGTSAGTRLVIDIQPGKWSGGPGLLTESGGRLFFGADDGQHGVELWVSDGTKSGTEMVKDIYPGDYAWPSLLTDVSGTLFFTAIDASHGRELWKSDGTEKGTRLVQDIYPDASTTYAPLHLTSLNGKLYFSAVLVEWGRELWVSDGSALGTYMVRDIKPGNGDGFPGWANLSPLVTVENVVLFTGEDFQYGGGLWQSDGTFNGTQLVIDNNPSIYASPYLIGNADDTVFFAGADTYHGYELWAYRYVLNRVYLPVMPENASDSSD